MKLKAKSLFNLGFLIENGREGLKKNLENAELLYRIAATLGNDAAKHNLERMCRSKVVVPEDPVTQGEHQGCLIKTSIM